MLLWLWFASGVLCCACDFVLVISLCWWICSGDFVLVILLCRAGVFAVPVFLLLVSLLCRWFCFCSHQNEPSSITLIIVNNYQFPSMYIILSSLSHSDFPPCFSHAYPLSTFFNLLIPLGMILEIFIRLIFFAPGLVPSQRVAIQVRINVNAIVEFIDIQNAWTKKHNVLGMFLCKAPSFHTIPMVTSSYIFWTSYIFNSLFTSERVPCLHRGSPGIPKVWRPNLGRRSICTFVVQTSAKRRSPSFEASNFSELLRTSHSSHCWPQLL